MMRTLLTSVLLVCLAAPAAAQDPAHLIRTVVRDTIEQTEQRLREERLRREQEQRQREQEQRQREQEQRQREQQQQRERQQLERERQREEQRQRQAEQRRGPEQVERTTRTLKLGASGELHVANISGDITIARGKGNDVTVEIIKTARGRTDEDAKEQLGLVQVEVVERAGRADIKAEYPRGDMMRRNNRRNINVDVVFNITAPPALRIQANSISGSITSRDMSGEIALESISGAIRVFNGGKISSAKSISGDVEVNETSIDGLLEASTASGSVVLRRVKARQLDVGSISGSVVLEEVDCPRLEAQTVSGDVRFSGALPKNSRLEMSSHSGNVHVVVTGGAGFEVEATSFSGAVRSDFDLTSQGATRRRNQSLRGVYGDGSAVLDLTTFSGSIVIGKR